MASQPQQNKQQPNKPAGLASSQPAAPAPVAPTLDEAAPAAAAPAPRVPARVLQAQKPARTLIRADGVPVMYSEKAALLHGMREYTGDPSKTPNTQAEGRAYLYGTGQGGATNTLDPSTFRISTASAEDLVEFALTEFGVHLNPKTDLLSLRSEVARQARLHGNTE